jgi:glycosyltransferase involved in cell wall biosynthesis
MNLKFTVVTVVFNAESVIRKTMESVLNQEYPPYEYLIFDGVSTDRTLEIADEYKELFFNKGIIFNVVSEKDTGIYNAMNKGVKAAKGDFISFLNAGDWYELDALKNINEFYNEDSFELTYGGLHYINPNGTVTNKMSKVDKFLISSRHWNHPSMFLKREIYQKYGFDEYFKAYADFNLYLKLRKNGTKIRVIDKVITNFVADGVSTDTNFKKVLVRSKEKYEAYRKSGFGRIYLIESYGWEIFKSIYFRIRS